MSKAGWKILADQTTGGAKNPEYAVDEDPYSKWETLDAPATTLPQSIAVDMGKTETIKAFTYLPRRDGSGDGMVDSYIYYISNDGVNWQQVAEGEFANIKSNPVERVITLDHPYNARYFKFTATHVISGQGVAVAELGIKVK